MSRHPYTYACDYVRSLVEPTKDGSKISRSDASAILAGIAKALGEEDHTALAEKLSVYYQAHEKEITAAVASKDIIRGIPL